MRTLLRPAAIVDAWFDLLQPGQAPTIHALRAAILAAGPELQQVVKWGNLIFTHRGSHAFAIVPHKSYVHLQVFRGALLAMEFPDLEGAGRGPRYLKQRYGLPVDEELVHEIVRAGIEVMHLPFGERDDHEPRHA